MFVPDSQSFTGQPPNLCVVELSCCGDLGRPADCARAAGRLYRLHRSAEPIALISGPHCAEARRRLAEACRRIGFAPRFATEAPEEARTERPVRVGLLGYGVVGQALAERLAGEADFEVAAILVRDRSKPRRLAPPCPPGDDEQAFAAVDFDILVDVCSSGEAGARLTLHQLERGGDVASANKQAIAGKQPLLDAAARRTGGRLSVSATVGGGAPFLETLGLAKVHGPIARIEGVLNGTVNFLLDRLSRGTDFHSAIAEARERGLAEEDPSQDLSGRDAAFKLRLLAANAFDFPFEAIEVEPESLSEWAAARIARSGQRWLQLASAESDKGRLRASVRLVPAQEAPFAAPPEEGNCLLITARDGRCWQASGRGAGGVPTAEAVLADLHDIAPLVAASAAEQLGQVA